MKPTQHQQKIYADILKEREYQDNKWGGNSHDDAQSPTDWKAYIYKYVVKLMRAPDTSTRKRRLRQIAALCFAALETEARKEENGEVAE